MKARVLEGRGDLEGSGRGSGRIDVRPPTDPVRTLHLLCVYVRHWMLVSVCAPTFLSSGTVRMPIMSAGFYTGEDSVPRVSPGDVSSVILRRHLVCLAACISRSKERDIGVVCVHDCRAEVERCFIGTSGVATALARAFTQLAPCDMRERGRERERARARAGEGEKERERRRDRKREREGNE